MYEDLIRKAAEDDRDVLVALRRSFHQHPELSCKEFATADRIQAELLRFGIPSRRVGETGVYAELSGNRPGKRTIVLRADIDALPITEEHDCPYRSLNPGVMHACGHDAHTASLLGAAKFLAAHRDLWGGTVRLAFQQGEEIGYGARLFVDGGFLKGADRTFGVHVESRIPVGKVSLTPGPNNASVDFFRISVEGKQAHVSTPERGVDALYVASQIVVGVQALVTRMSNPTDSLLIGIGKLEAGTAYNVVAGSAVLEGTIRAISPGTRARAVAGVERVAKAQAESYGASVSFEWKNFTDPLINDARSAREAQAVLERLWGKESVVVDRPCSLGGDDFAAFINAVPGVYAFVGSGNDRVWETREAHHTSHFDIDEQCIVIASSLYAAYAVNFLNGTIGE